MPVATLTEAEPLSADERALLAEMQSTLERGARLDVDRGAALLTIRDGRLYRETHETFEAFCGQPEWGLSRKRAYDLIALAEVRLIVSPTGDTPAPEVESVGRELATLRDEPEQLREAWTEVVEQHGPAPTAAQVREVVRGASPELALVPAEAPVLRGPDETAEALDTDPRYLSVEDGAAVLGLLPAADQIVWPVEAFDVANVDKAMAWMDKEWPLIRASWRVHKAALKKTSGKLRAVV